MRLLVAVVLAACSSSKPIASPVNTTGASPPASSPTLVTDAPLDCEATVEDSPPGNADRFKFEAPDGRQGYKNREGQVVIAPTLQFAYEFKPGGIAAAVDASGRFVFIDATGNVLARAYAFDNGPDYFQEGFARIVDDAGKIGYISDRGLIIIKPQYDAADSFCHGVAQVSLAGQTFQIDRTGARK